MESLLKSPMKLVLLTGMWAFLSLSAGVLHGASSRCFWMDLGLQWNYCWCVLSNQETSELCVSSVLCVVVVVPSMSCRCKVTATRTLQKNSSGITHKWLVLWLISIFITHIWYLCLHSMALQPDGSMQALWHLWFLSPTCNMQGTEWIKQRLPLQAGIYRRWNNILQWWVKIYKATYMLQNMYARSQPTLCS